MRRSRIDVFPLLVIMAGGVVGALLTVSPLLLFGPIEDALAPIPILSPPEEAPTVVQPVKGRTVSVWVSPDGTSVVYGDANGNVYRVNAGGGVPESVQISPAAEWNEFRPITVGPAEGTAEPGKASYRPLR